ncbi:MAG: peptidylprolyl isomerase [bacterium]|nr:peptidylprolyl isomerase [bacterium]
MIKSRVVIPVLVVSAAMLIMAASAFGQRETVDRIAVVVGSEVILASEIGNQMQLLSLQTGVRPNSEKEVLKLQQEVLDQMVSDRLFLLAARKDTSLRVRREEIEMTLEEKVGDIALNFASDEEFKAALAAEGLTIRDLKKKYREDIENQLLKQRYIQKKLYTVSVSRHEVEQFYAEFKDSIPSQPEAIRLAHILLKPKPSQAAEDSVLEEATRLRQQILDGADFAETATKYSSLGAGVNGGDLGFVAREDVVPEFARAAFGLPEGGMSGVIRTEFGYHVIRREGQRDNKLHLRHLLLAVQPSAEDTAAAYSLADSLLALARSGEDFSKLAKEFSVDNNSRAQGGELGWIATKEAPLDIRPFIQNWTVPGEYRGPVETSNGLHLFKLLEYAPEKHLSFENDYDQIKEMARQDKTGRMVDEWIEELKETTYISYSLGDDEN